MLEQILAKHTEFNEYLDSLDLSVLQNQYTRNELQSFYKQLYSMKTRSIAYEVSKMTDEMKKKEYPELLGVHHFPALREINFLSEEEKIKLDSHLVRFRKGNYVSGLWQAVEDSEKVSLVEDFLLQKEIVEERHFALCPKCDQGYISSALTLEEKQGLETILLEKDDLEFHEKIDELLEYVCMECDHSTEPEEIETLNFKKVFKMVQERDASLDNV